MTSTHIKLPKFDTQWALFLDVDGTLLDIAPQPDGVTVTTDLLDILSGLSLYGNGAIAFQVYLLRIKDLALLFTTVWRHSTASYWRMLSGIVWTK
jgi:hypothetical protein